MTPAGDNSDFETDPLLDACLDELLSGVKPPDLKDQILRRLEKHTARARLTKQQSSEQQSSEQAAKQRPAEQPQSKPRSSIRDSAGTRPAGNNSAAGDSTVGGKSKRLSDAPDRQPVVVETKPASAGDRLRQHRPTSRIGWLVALGGTSLVLLVGAYLVNSLPNRGTSIAQNDPAPATPKTRDASNGAPIGDAANHDNSAAPPSLPPDDRQPDRDSSDDSERASTATPHVTPDDDTGTPGTANSDASENSIPSVVPIPSDVPADLTAPRNPLAPRQPMDRMAKQDADAVIQDINELLRSSWQSHGIVAAPAIDDEQWCQRTVAYLLGRPATRKEVAEFLSMHDATRRDQFLDRLLGPDYATEYATYWSLQWTSWLLSGVSTTTNTGRTLRVGLEHHLADRLRTNDGFDKWVYELLTATGCNEPKESDYNPATNYLLALADRDRDKTATRIASESCRVLLSQRLQCAQCHTDPLSGVPQERFWQVASAFKPLQITPVRANRSRLADEPIDSVTLSYKNDKGEVQTASPADLLGEPLANADATVSTRAALARNLVNTPQLSRAVVNRLWSAAHKYGFTMPVDSMARHNPVSHPELVETLSEQVIAHDYDLRQLQRWIVRSDAFDRSDVMTVRNENDFPDGGSIAYFSRSYYRPVLFREPQDGLGWLVQGGAPRVTNTQDAFNQSDLLGSRQRNADDFRKPKDSDKKLLQPDDGTIGQLIPMSELATVRALTNQKNLTHEQQMWHAYLLVRGREPSRAELDQAEAIYTAAKGNDVDALERIFWVLLNTET